MLTTSRPNAWAAQQELSPVCSEGGALYLQNRMNPWWKNPWLVARGAELQALLPPVATTTTAALRAARRWASSSSACPASAKKLDVFGSNSTRQQGVAVKATGIIAPSHHLLWLV
jgi:hypothetical protein